MSQHHSTYGAPTIGLICKQLSHEILLFLCRLLSYSLLLLHIITVSLVTTIKGADTAVLPLRWFWDSLPIQVSYCALTFSSL